jgi:hypothetical protein
MVLRLVLVGIVAGLGFSPPAESELAGWTRSIQIWLDAQPAESNARTPLVVDEVVFNAFAVEGPAVVTGGPQASASQDEADELAALDLEFESIRQDEPATVQPAPIGDVAVEEGLAFDAIVEEMVADFARVASATGEQAPKVEESDDEELALADALDMEWAAPSTEVAAAEPLAVGDDLYPGEAFALNHDAEGLDAPAAPGVTDAEAGASAGNQIGNAVRLTRDALFAWLNLVQNSAIVTIPR